MPADPRAVRAGRLGSAPAGDDPEGQPRLGADRRPGRPDRPPGPQAGQEVRWLPCPRAPQGDGPRGPRPGPGRLQRLDRPRRPARPGHYRRLRKELKENLRQDAGQLNAWLQLLSTARNLERIADHAKDIAETIVYLQEGTIIRHKQGTPSANS